VVDVEHFSCNHKRRHCENARFFRLAQDLAVQADMNRFSSDADRIEQRSEPLFGRYADRATGVTTSVMGRPH